ncbi:MAG TPA: hypothetical protein VK507_23205 [Iamia sp.]|nr:hypothetical protein [Iamia sp.]
MVGSATQRGYVTLVDATPEAEILVERLGVLAQRLTDAGFTGVPRAARSVDAAPWLHDPDHGWVFGHLWSPAAFVAWSGDLSGYDEIGRGPSVLGEWPQPEDVVDDLCSAAAGWVANGGDEGVFTLGAFGVEVTDASALAGLLRQAARDHQTGGVVCSNSARPSGRQVVLRAGMALAQVLGEVEHWTDRVDALRHVVLRRPDLTDIAYARVSPTGLFGWEQQNQPAPLPGISSGNLTTHRHLLAQYAPDAHGLQILRGAHLEKARDLSAWTITDLGHGRHLVEATDLEPWYAHGETDGGTLERARRDFGPMILTRDVLAAHPPPWVASR